MLKRQKIGSHYGSLHRTFIFVSKISGLIFCPPSKWENWIFGSIPGTIIFLISKHLKICQSSIALIVQKNSVMLHWQKKISLFWKYIKFTICYMKCSVIYFVLFFVKFYRHIRGNYSTLYQQKSKFCKSCCM